MVRMKDKQFVKSGNNLGVNNIRSNRFVKHHIEEVSAIGEVVAGIDQWVTNGFFIGKRGNGSDLGKKSCSNIGESSSVVSLVISG